MPVPQQSSFPILVDLIGIGLRPEDAAQCLTSEMCLPIFPTTAHPTGREPLRPNQPFPSSGCYHWAGASINVRVKNGDYQNHSDRGWHLSFVEDMRMGDVLSTDWDDALDAQDDAARKAGVITGPERDERGMHHQ